MTIDEQIKSDCRRDHQREDHQRRIDFYSDQWAKSILNDRDMPAALVLTLCSCGCGSHKHTQ